MDDEDDMVETFLNVTGLERSESRREAAIKVLELNSWDVQHAINFFFQVGEAGVLAALQDPPPAPDRSRNGIARPATLRCQRTTPRLHDCVHCFFCLQVQDNCTTTTSQ